MVRWSVRLNANALHVAQEVYAIVTNATRMSDGRVVLGHPPSVDPLDVIRARAREDNLVVVTRRGEDGERSSLVVGLSGQREIAKFHGRAVGGCFFAVSRVLHPEGAMNHILLGGAEVLTTETTAEDKCNPALALRVLAKLVDFCDNLGGLGFLGGLGERRLLGADRRPPFLGSHGTRDWEDEKRIPRVGKAVAILNPR